MSFQRKLQVWSVSSKTYTSSKMDVMSVGVGCTKNVCPKMFLLGESLPESIPVLKLTAVWFQKQRNSTRPNISAHYFMHVLINSSALNSWCLQSESFQLSVLASYAVTLYFQSSISCHTHIPHLGQMNSITWTFISSMRLFKLPHQILSDLQSKEKSLKLLI